MIDMTNNWKGFNWPDMGLHPGLVSAIGTRSLDSLPWHRDGQNPMPGGIIYLITNFPLKAVLGVNGVLGAAAGGVPRNPFNQMSAFNGKFVISKNKPPRMGF
jgi:hypothetical protein